MTSISDDHASNRKLLSENLQFQILPKRVQAWVGDSPLACAQFARFFHDGGAIQREPAEPLASYLEQTVGTLVSQNLISLTLSVSQRLVKLLVVILLVSVLGCRTGGPAISPIESGTKEQSQPGPRPEDAAQLTTPGVVMPPRCPSQDFDQYLKRFADPDRDDVRQAFTAEPLEYDVPRYLIVDDTDEDAPLMYTTEISGPERSKYFFLRYFDSAGDYLDVGRDEAYLNSARTKGPSFYRTQMAVKAFDNGDREVTVGIESELDIFLFRRMQNCWYLSRATNTRD